MTDSLTTSVRLTKPTVNGDSGTWPTLLNSDMDYIDEAINQTVTVAIADADLTLTVDGSSSDQGRYLRYNFTGALTADRTVTLPAVEKVGWATNATTGSHNVILTAGTGTLAVAPSTQWSFIHTQGSAIASPGINLGGIVSAGDEVIGTGNIRAIGTTYGAILRSDDTNGYLLQTVSGSPKGNFSSLRPFQWAFSNGFVTIDATGAGASFGGALGVGGNLTMNDTAEVFGGKGYSTRNPLAGTYGGHYFNLIWDGTHAGLYIDATLIGTFVFTSDRRVKHSIESMPNGALDRICNLRPVTYRFADIGIFKDDGLTRSGFIADEVAALIPSAVNGAADAVNDDGSIKPQSLDPLPLIAELVAAVQELRAEVASLRAAQ